MHVVVKELLQETGLRILVQLGSNLQGLRHAVARFAAQRKHDVFVPLVFDLLLLERIDTQ